MNYKKWFTLNEQSKSLLFGILYQKYSKSQNGEPYWLKYAATLLYEVLLGLSSAEDKPNSAKSGQ